MNALDGVKGTACDARQYQQSLPSPDNPFPSVTCLTREQSIGLALTIESSFLSLVSVVATLIWIFWNVRWYSKNVRSDWRLFRTSVDIYMFSLLLFDILQAIGGTLNIRWAHNGIVTMGLYCTVQGIVAQFSQLGLALSTLILTVHTFVGAVWRVGWEARGFAGILVGLAWIFSALWVGIGAGIHKNYETPTPFWCWISPRYPGERLAGEYIWLWLALFASLLYIPLSFWAKGYFSVDEKKWYKFHRSNLVMDYSQRRAALGMLLYPVAYSIMVLPLSLARWSLFNHKHVSSEAAATLFGGMTMFYLSGAINALLLLVFRPRLLLLTRPEVSGQSDIELAP